MRRPKNYAYWLDEAPPLGITLFSGLQHIGLVCAFLPIPLAIAREAGLADARIVDVISVSMLVLGVIYFPDPDFGAMGSLAAGLEEEIVIRGRKPALQRARPSGALRWQRHTSF